MGHGRYPPPRCKHPRMGPIAAAVPYRSARQPDPAGRCTLRRPSGCSFANCESESAADVFNYDPERETYCMTTVPTPWRDTPGPTWPRLAAMLRNQCRQHPESPGRVQQGLTLS